MKRLVLLLIFAIVPTALFAQVADRDVLLTQDGTLYTIESTDNDGSASPQVQRFLKLTVQTAGGRTQTIVPESLAAGMHWRPALAYDSESQTLFVFWLKMPNAMSSELLLASYSNGQWRPALSIDNQAFHLRYNLRIGITSRIAQLQDDGSYADFPMLLIHTVWWEQTGLGEGARYALITVNKGTATVAELRDLSEFAGTPPLFPNTASPQFNPEVLRHPAFVDNGTQDSIDVIFGDTYFNFFSRTTLKPIAEGRIHIPIGARPTVPRVPAPLAFSDNWSGRISTIAPPRSTSLLLYNTTRDAVSYIMYSGGSWSSVKRVALSDKLSAEAAVAALSRMMSQY